MSRTCWSITKILQSHSVSFKVFGKRFVNGTRNISFLALFTNPHVTLNHGLKRFVGRLKQNTEVILAACWFEENSGYMEGNINIA